MITQTTLNEMETFLMSRITRAQMLCGETWYDLTFEKSMLPAANKVVTTLSIPGNVATGQTVTAIRLLNPNGEVAAYRDENINREGSTDDLMYRLEHSLTFVNESGEQEYVTFALSEEGELMVTYPDGYTGPIFQVNDGLLEVIQ